MKKVIHLLSSAISIVFCLIVSINASGEAPTDGVSLKAAELIKPSIEPGIDPRENNIYVAYIMNSNIGSMTEIYRSMNSESGFTLINTIPSDDRVYEDRNLKSRTTYYYKVRAVKDAQYSEFSDVVHFRTNAYNYPPDFTAKAISETTIELTLTDKSYNDVWYDVDGWSVINGVREEVFGQHFISMADSGRTQVILHNNAKPGTRYEYTVYMGRTYDDDFGLEFGSVSVTTPLETPRISGDRSLVSDIYFMIDNPNPGSFTEIYRSLSPEAGYALIATIAGEERQYVDRVSKSSINYYYKVRAIKDNPPYELLYSAFSPYDVGIAMGEAWGPEFTAKAINENTVELTVTDRSYQDNSYYVDGYYIVNGIRNYIFYSEFIMADSGSTRKITHDKAIGGTQYEYIIYMSRTYDDQFDLESGSTNVTTPDAMACYGKGSIERELWTGITGTYVTSIPVNTPPNAITDLTSFETPSNEGSNYGARVRGYLCVPFTADYTFWIASDDRSELWLSTDDDPAKRSKIASVTGYTAIRQWTKYPSQTSAPVHLEGGRRYYIETLHKEASGGDHLAVGWKAENNPVGYSLSELPIPGNRLIKFDEPVNKAPIVAITNPKEGQIFQSPASMIIAADAVDSDGKICDVKFYHGDILLGMDDTAPYTFQWNNVPMGSYYIQAIASDCFKSSSHAVNITVTEGTCAGAGMIRQEFWTNVSGTSVSAIPTLTEPDVTHDLTLFEGPASSMGDNYGSRIRGYLCPPATGEYIFWIAGDDQVELSLSTNDNPANKKRIAYHTGWTSKRQWTKYSTQQSVRITLNANQRYYVEALMKEGTGGDHVSVGWQMADGSLQRPIAGTHLIPFGSSGPEPTACAGAGTLSVETWTGIDGARVSSIPVNSPPNVTGERNIFEAPTNVGSNFGSRFRGYVCVPTSGNYTFWIASDDHGELWLSTDNDPANKRRIAYHTGWTSPRQWTKYTTQQSVPVALVGGQQYYIEALYKEDENGDNMAVGWQLPDGTMERPIPGNRLSPFKSGTSAMAARTASQEGLYSQINIYPNPATSNDPKLTISGYEGIRNTIETSIQIISMTGEVAFADRISCGGDCSSYLMNINKQLVPGVYLVRLKTNGVISARRLLVK